jgi:hypothetical protein
MAKEQELPLNPQKISGLCGRLLCCLSYEEEGYKEMRQTLPRVGQRCSTPTGEGRVIAVNILRRQVTLLVEGQRVDVPDRDLGTVVRWDPTSRAAAPPPSLGRPVEAEEASAEAAGAEDARPPGEPSLPGRIRQRRPPQAPAERPPARGTPVPGRSRPERPRSPLGDAPSRTFRRANQDPGASPPDSRQQPPPQQGTDESASSRQPRGQRRGPRRGRGGAPGPDGGSDS